MSGYALAERRSDELSAATSRSDVERIVEPSFDAWCASFLGGALVGTAAMFLTGAAIALAEAALMKTEGTSGWIVLGMVGGGGVGGLIATAIFLAWTVLRVRRAVAWLDEHDWRPREGFEHPRGRTDTQARWEIEREVRDEGVVVGIRKWEYAHRWRRGELVESRCFSVDELDLADEHATELVSRVSERVDARGLLERWVSDRGTREMVPSISRPTDAGTIADVGTVESLETLKID